MSGDDNKNAFEPLLPESSILRHLPYALHDEQRSYVEALALSADIISVAYARMEKCALIYDDFSMAPTSSHVTMYMDAWQIVHEVFLTRQILRRVLPNGFGPRQQAFFDDSQPAHEMRRMRDHLSENVPNLAKRKGRRPPIYGTLSWFVPKAGSASGLLPSGRLTAISAGGIILDEIVQKCGLVIRRFSDRSVDNFSLNAFNETFFITRVLSRLRIVLQGFQENFQENIDVQREVANGMGEDMLKPVSLYGHAVVMDVEAKEQEKGIFCTSISLVHPNNAKLKMNDIMR